MRCHRTPGKSDFAGRLLNNREAVNAEIMVLGNFISAAPDRRICPLPRPLGWEPTKP